MDSLKNICYLFIPFIYDRPGDYARIIEALNRNAAWNLIHDEIHYMLKYVADKIDSQKRDTCQCFHYVLDDNYRGKWGFGKTDEWFSTQPHHYGNSDVRFRFQLIKAELFCFSTKVCIIAFQLHFEHDDPFWISNAQYYLKKVSREQISRDDDDRQFSFLDMAKAFAGCITDTSKTSFFYYANPSTERANVLTYIEVNPKKDGDYKKELFYLRRCYSEGFLYDEGQKQNDDEIFTPSNDIVWGISPEAAVCLVSPDAGHEVFIRETFYKNFNAQYLFMYVLLLHQKYVLYMFLTIIGIGTYNNLEKLEEYRQQLYEFEADFVFSCVTEVPQYQNLYDKMAQSFALKKMYEDVHEPLVSLGEIRREAAEKEQEKRDKKVNDALFMLSILSFFSALVDSFDFANSFFGLFLGESAVRIVQVVCIIGIVITVVLVFQRLFNSKK